LREKAINQVNNYYTWKISNRNTYDEYIFSPDNNSLSPYYDSFTLSIGTQTSLTSSVILDCPIGEYHYSIYEMSSQYNLDINMSLGVIEVGLLIIEGTSSEIISFTESNDDTVKVFNEL
jgi:hypothetical protein